MEKHIFAIGDIHGCLEKFKDLSAHLPVKTEDTVVFLGDYINRGPDTRGVLDFLLDFKEKYPNTIFLLGNHEYYLLEYARTKNVEFLQTLRVMGVEATLVSYDQAPVHALRDLSFMPENHVQFLESLRPFYKVDQWIFVHAGLKPGVAPEECELEQMLCIRGLFLSDPWPGPETIVFGHTSFLTPFVSKNKIGIDTGAVYGNMLTAVELPSVRFHHS